MIIYHINDFPEYLFDKNNHIKFSIKCTKTRINTVKIKDKQVCVIRKMKKQRTKNLKYFLIRSKMKNTKVNRKSIEELSLNRRKKISMFQNANYHEFKIEVCFPHYLQQIGIICWKNI